MRYFLLVVIFAISACGRSVPQSAGLDVAKALGGVDVDGYLRAEKPREFHFPSDHGPHPGFRNEWWYFTGNLADPQGRRFGFQFTVFRVGLAPGGEKRPSSWAATDIYMAHFAITDIKGKRFHAFERLERGAMGLAGATLEPFEVWIDDWRLSGARRGGFPWRVQAAEQGTALDLTLIPDKPPVLQGEGGLSRKSDQPGNASYYYSIPRMSARGRLTLAGTVYTVQGKAWLDREWSTSALGEDQVGWDWFALQLDDGSDLMYYRLRRNDGSTDPHSTGSLVDSYQQRHALGDVQLKVLDHWDSPKGGRYPGRWSLDAPAQKTHLSVEPVLANQELDVSVRYWEGAVVVRGTHNGREVNGRGYVELTGYAGKGPKGGGPIAR